MDGGGGGSQGFNELGFSNFVLPDDGEGSSQGFKEFEFSDFGLPYGGGGDSQGFKGLKFSDFGLPDGGGGGSQGFNGDEFSNFVIQDGGGGGSQGFNELEFSDNGFEMPNVGDLSNQNTPIATSYKSLNAIIREKDRFLPIDNIVRIMKRALPYDANISADSKKTIQECVSEFISFLTSEANDHCQQELRKRVTAEDLLWAMKKLGFDTYFYHLTLFLEQYRKAKDNNHGVVPKEAFEVNEAISPLFEPRVTFFGGMTSPIPLMPAPPQPLHMRPSGGLQGIYGEETGENLFGMLNNGLRGNTMNGDGTRRRSSQFMTNFSNYGGFK